jgi:hypothetical protein
MYHKKVRDYIKKVIRIRKRLIAEGKSRLNLPLAWHHINHLEKYLKYYPYNKDYQMASFWRRNAAKVLELIPGQSSRIHDELVHEFNDIDSLTMSIDVLKK